MPFFDCKNIINQALIAMKSSKRLCAKCLVMVLLLLPALLLHAQSPTWQWAKNYGMISYYNYIGKNICTDAAGNSLLAGHYTGQSITFGSYTLTNTSFQPDYDSDVYIVKHDAMGNVLWAKSFGGSGNDAIYGICTDANGNIFITGFFIGVATAPVGMVLGTYTVYPVGSGAGYMFLAKLDQNGNVLWAKSAGGGFARSVCTDAGGNVYVVGSSASSYSFTIGSYNFPSNGATDFFIAKYSPIGSLLWAKLVGGARFDYANSVAADAAGNIIVAGEFQGPVMAMGTQTLSNSDPSGNSMDAFIAKYDASGNVLWASSITGSSDDLINCAAVDAADNILVTGNFMSPVLACGTSTFGNAGSADLFIAKYNSSGNLQWAKAHGGSGTDNCYSICCDNSGNAYVTGEFYSNTLFMGSTTLNNSSGADHILVGKYDVAGNEVWALAESGNSDQFGNGICFDGGSSIYVTGYFRSSTLNIGSIPLTNNSGANNVFIAKLPVNASQSTGIGTVTSGGKSLSIFPNPANNQCRIRLPQNGNCSLKLYNASGAMVKQASFTGPQNNDWLMDTSELPNGIYFMEVVADQQYTGKFIISH